MDDMYCCIFILFCKYGELTIGQYENACICSIAKDSGLTVVLVYAYLSN